MSQDRPSLAPSPPEVDLLITANETNHHHGVGVFLQRLFGAGSDFACLRSTTMYGGEEPFGRQHLELHSHSLVIAEAESRLRRLLEGVRVRRILCVPYYREEFVHGSLAKKITGAPLCSFVMDDQNIFAPHVSDTWVERLLAVSDLRLGISQEMCVAYEAKFGHVFHLLPPVVERCADLVPCYWLRENDAPLRCAMIGNIWTATRLLQLRGLLRATGLHVDWYGNGPNASWHDGKFDEWEEDHLHCIGHLPEEDLVASLASYPFILIPSGSADENDDNPAFSRLSLPSRLLFLHARTDTPVLVLGSPRTAAGHFVQRMGTGMCSPASPAELSAAIERLVAPATHEHARANVRKASPSLVLPDGGAWIWRSLANGSPEPAPFSRIFPPIDEARRREIVANVEMQRREPPANPSADTTSFAYPRVSMLPALIAAGLIRDALPQDLEVTEFLRAAAVHQVTTLAPAEADVLYVGENLPEGVTRLRPDLRVWKVADFAAWRSTEKVDPPHEFAPLSPAASRAGTTAPTTFSFIWSAGECDQVSQTDDAITRFASFCEASTRPDGWNFHAFTAVLHPDYFWVHPLYSRLQSRFLRRRWWPGLDDVLADEAAFFMSENAYNRYWKQTTIKSHEEFGRIFWVGLLWNKAH